MVWLSYADLDGVPSQTAGTSSLLASDWNTYVRDNFDSIKFGHVVVADSTAKSAISAVEGIMVYQSNVDTFFLYNGTAWVEAIGTVSLVDLAVTTAKIAASAVTEAKIDTGAVTSAKILDGTIVNADVNASAAIAYSKLSLASSVTSADIVDSTIVLGDLAAALQAFLVPSGTVSAFAGSSAPTGYLLCDGTAVSRSTYSGLFAITSTTYGVGDGSTTFNVPNLKGRTVIGVGVGVDAIPATGVLGTAQGAATVTLTAAESGTTAHGHNNSVSESSAGAVTYGSIVNNTSFASGTGSAQRYIPNTSQAGGLVGNEGDNTFGTASNHSHSVSVTISNSTAAAAASAHTNIQPSLPLNYIIKT